MREIHKICLNGITGLERHKAIDIISAAIAMQYHKNVLVINEGYASDSAIEQIPPSIKVFVVCGENKISAADQSEQLDAEIKAIDGSLFVNDNRVNDDQIMRGIDAATAVHRVTAIID